MNNNISPSTPAFGARLIFPHNARNIKYCKNNKFVGKEPINNTDVGRALDKAKTLFETETKGKPGIFSFCGFSDSMDKLVFAFKHLRREKNITVEKKSFIDEPRQILKIYEKALNEIELENKEIKFQNKRHRQGYFNK